MRYVTLVFDWLVMRYSFLVQTPVKVGAKKSLLSFSSRRSGSVQIPKSDSLAPAPGRSLREIEIDDL